MDLERIMHRGYKTSLVAGIVLSGLLVTLVALIGRGTLNLAGAVLLDEPRDTTVIALVEPVLTDGVTISNISFLRKENLEGSLKPSYTYHVRTSDENDYFTRLLFDEAKAEWTLARFEKLHGN